MTALKIITVPSPILRRKAIKIKNIDSSIKDLISHMVETLRKVGGLGLAAPQVGQPIRIAVIESNRKSSPKADRLDEKNKKSSPKIPLTILINPEIIEYSKETEKSEEGCLSIPEIWGVVERAKSVKVKALNEKGKKVKIKAKDLFARVLQHEIDHLNGILFTDKADVNTLHKIGSKGEIIKVKL